MSKTLEVLSTCCLRTVNPNERLAMKRRTASLRAGFTLIEIMIVVAIIGLLAAFAVPNFVNARATTQAKGCISNLRLLEGAKTSWALDKNKGGNVAPSQDDLKPYIKLNADGNIPGCPAGGTYTIGGLEETPTCSLANDPRAPHKIP
jgi:prepilin-type N-terminal cleavage/methylation domain-containing protein